MVERHRGEGERRHGLAGGEAIPAHPVGQPRRHRLGLAQIVDHHDALDGGQPGADFCQLPGDLDALAVIPVAIGGDQQLRLDLGEAVEHRARAEIGRGRRPGGPERDHRQHRRNAFGPVWQKPGHPVAFAHAGLRQRLLQTRDLRLEFTPAPAHPGLVFAAKHQRGGSVVAGSKPEQVLGEIQLCAGEKSLAQDPFAGDPRFAALVADHAEMVPDR